MIGNGVYWSLFALDWQKWAFSVLRFKLGEPLYLESALHDKRNYLFSTVSVRKQIYRKKKRIISNEFFLHSTFSLYGKVLDMTFWFISSLPRSVLCPCPATTSGFLLCRERHRRVSRQRVGLLVPRGIPAGGKRQDLLHCQERQTTVEQLPTCLWRLDALSPKQYTSIISISIFLCNLS